MLVIYQCGFSDFDDFPVVLPQNILTGRKRTLKCFKVVQATHFNILKKNIIETVLGMSL